jgi:acetyltransferase-like isoleucine patch superfamily enzyme
MVFCKYTKNKNCNVNILGDVTLINPNIIVGKNVVIYPNCMFFGDGPIIIGDDVNIGNGTIIYASSNGGGVEIGRGTQIAAHCYIIDMDHGTKKGMPIRCQSNTVAAVKIEEEAWLAAGCKILKGSHVGCGAIIGAGGVVKGVIPSNAIAVGIPAKVKRYRE